MGRALLGTAFDRSSVCSQALLQVPESLRVMGEEGALSEQRSKKPCSSCCSPMVVQDQPCSALPQVHLPTSPPNPACPRCTCWVA